MVAVNNGGGGGGGGNGIELILTGKIFSRFCKITNRELMKLNLVNPDLFYNNLPLSVLFWPFSS